MEPNLLQYLGACLAILVGMRGLLAPHSMEPLLGLVASNAVGQIEIRVLFGSFLVVLPIAAMVAADTAIFEFYGLAALAAAIIKSVFTVLDKCTLSTIYFGILVDIILATLLMSSLL